MQTYQERRIKVDEHVKALEGHMTKLRYVYTKVQESTRNMQTRPVEVISLYPSFDSVQYVKMYFSSKNKVYLYVDYANRMLYENQL